MKPFLVRTRLPAEQGSPGPMVIYVAMFDTPVAALGAVKEAIPAGWTAEEVIGEADPLLVVRRKLKAGAVEQLA